MFSQTEYGDYLLNMEYYNRKVVVAAIDVNIMMHRRHKNRLVIEYMVNTCIIVEQWSDARGRIRYIVWR